MAEMRNPSELVDYLVGPRDPESHLEDLDEELTTIAARLALDFGSSDPKHK